MKRAVDEGLANRPAPAAGTGFNKDRFELWARDSSLPISSPTKANPVSRANRKLRRPLWSEIRIVPEWRTIPLLVFLLGSAERSRRVMEGSPQQPATLPTHFNTAVLRTYVRGLSTGGFGNDRKLTASGITVFRLSDAEHAHPGARCCRRISNFLSGNYRKPT